MEDDQSMRALLRDMLAAFGIKEIEVVSDGRKAFDALRHFPADLVITDWVMEAIDGLEFTRLVRTAPASPNPYIPIIMLTSQSTADRVLQARDSGITEFLIKPLTANGLYNRIASIVQNPRRFVRADDFFGPDRRRADRDYMGEERREDDEC